MNIEEGLVGYWKLSGDCKDYSGKNNHGINHGAHLTAEGQKGKENSAAEFNGKNSYIEIKNSKSLNFSTGDFSLSAWIYTEKDDDIIGDIISKYDQNNRKGFNFSVISNQYRHPSNRRNVFFGIDNAKLSSWKDCGNIAAPDNVGVYSLCVHDGKLYAGSYTRSNGAYSDKNPQGHVYRYEGEKEWTDCGRLGNSSNVLCLSSYMGELYAGVAFAKVENGYAGKVFKYDEKGGNWIDCGQLGNSLRVECMAVFKNKLYVGALHDGNGRIYCYEGGTKWRSCDEQGGNHVVSLSVYNGSLYAGRKGDVFRYNGRTKWADCGKLGNSSQTWSFAVYNGKLFVGTWPFGHVYRYESDKHWTDCGCVEKVSGAYTVKPTNSDSREVMALAVYNGKLYGSLYPTGEVFCYDGGTAWNYVGTLGRQGHGTSITWRRNREGFWTGNCKEMPPKFKKCFAGAPGASRTPALAVYQGKLYAGTWNWEFDLPGHVYCIEAGKSICSDYELDPGWKHLSVVKDSNKIKLYIDGKLKVGSLKFDASDYNISNKESLKIGFGNHNYFKGKINQVRIYNRALRDKEIQALTEKERR